MKNKAVIIHNETEILKLCSQVKRHDLLEEILEVM